MWAYSGEKVGNVAYINLHYNDLFLQTAFLREKEENHVRVGGGGSEKKSAFKISSTHYLWAKSHQQIHYKSLCLYRKALFIR